MNIDKSWKDVYIEMLSNPLENMNDTRFCETYNVNHDSFRHWKYVNRQQIFDEVDRRRKNYLKQLRATAYKSLMSKLDKDTNALKLFFQLSGDLIERTENRTEVMTQEDLKRGISKMLEEISTKQKAWEGTEDVEAGKAPAPKDVQGESNQSGKEPGKDLPPTGTV